MRSPTRWRALSLTGSKPAGATSAHGWSGLRFPTPCWRWWPSLRPILALPVSWFTPTWHIPCWCCVTPLSISPTARWVVWSPAMRKIACRRNLIVLRFRPWPVWWSLSPRCFWSTTWVKKISSSAFRPPWALWGPSPLWCWLSVSSLLKNAWRPR